MGTVKQLDNRVMPYDIAILEDGKLLTRYWIDNTINAILDRIN